MREESRGLAALDLIIEKDKILKKILQLKGVLNSKNYTCIT